MCRTKRWFLIKTIQLLLLTCAVLISNLPFKSYAQSKPDTTNIKALLGKINNYNNQYTSEKLYLSFDKPYYAIGDTIWFKAYLLNAATRKASAYSNKIYIDLLNDSSKLVQSLVIPMSAGLGQGDFKLDEKMHEGSYTIRAYTNWMQNFGESRFFYQHFYIGKPAGNPWLISEQHQATPTDAGKKIKLALQLKDVQGRPVVAEALTMRVLEGSKGILKSDVQSAVDGTINTEFVIPPKTDARKLSLMLASRQDKKKVMRFPFYSQAEGDIDLQFMPEGGSLVAGLYSRVGFKAIGADGLGTDVEGRIINNKNEEVAAFKSMHHGMGNFAIVPNPGDTYMAKLKLPDGQEKSYNLPVPKASGIVLRVDAISNPDTVRLYITATPGIATENNGYYLLAEGKDINYFGAAFQLIDGHFNTVIPKSAFPTGIINFTIINAAYKPISARKVFINHHDQLKITTTTDKPVYAANDSIALNFMVTDHFSNPMQANFSVAVTDDSQVKNNVQDQQINSYFLLSSELKGNVEEANWYFDNDQPLAAKALDNLILTQGWTGFTPESILTKPIPQPAYRAESDNNIEGRLTNFFNKAAPNRQVTLLSHWKNIFVMDTVSNQDGRFTFKDLPVSDSIAYTIKIHNARGKEAAVGISVNEFKPAAIPPPDSIRLMPWYVNTDPTLFNYIKASEKRLADINGPVNTSGKLLKQVNIRDVRKARLQGEGGEDIYFADVDMDERELTKHGNISLLQFMKSNIKGFHLAPYKGYGEFLWMNASMVRNISIDSIWVSRYYFPPQRYTDFMISMLDNIPAAAVKNLVVYHKPTPNGKDWMSFIMIKTRSGNGPILKETPGMYVYRPLPLYIPRNFYRPRYEVKNQHTKADLRSTMHWEPNLVSDNTGNGKLSFYAADRPGTYTVSIEGTDMQGHFGVSRYKITIAPAINAK